MPHRPTQDLRPLIDKKKRGDSLEAKEIAHWVRGVVAEDFPNYQNTALLMAILLRGMNLTETVALTREMARQGSVLHRPKHTKRIGKHSTGGVGDKTTFLLGPLLASYDLQVPFMSGRGLGHTGGTIDKLSGIRGIRTNLTPSKVNRILEQHGFCIFEQNKYFAPADAKIYALRNASGTVDSIPLIVASIISKKLQEGLHGLLLDVKYGSGAIMPSLSQAKRLGDQLLSVARALGLKTTAVYTAMEQPLGRAVGNNMEIQECLEILNGEGLKDLVHITVRLAKEMLRLAGKSEKDLKTHEIRRRLLSGEILPIFLSGLSAQGAATKSPTHLKLALQMKELKSPHTGWVKTLNARKIGEATMLLGAGRGHLGATIDPKAGVLLQVKIGDPIRRGQAWIKLRYRSSQHLPRVLTLLRSAFEVSSKTQKIPPKIAGVRHNH